MVKELYRPILRCYLRRRFPRFPILHSAAIRTQLEHLPDGSAACGVDPIRRDFTQRHQNELAQFRPRMGQDEGFAVQHPIPPEQQIQIQSAGRAGNFGDPSRRPLDLLQLRQRGEGIRSCRLQRADRIQIVGLILCRNGAIRIPRAGLIDSGEAADPPQSRQAAQTEAEMRLPIPQVGTEGDPDFRIVVGRCSPLYFKYRILRTSVFSRC